MDITKLVSDLLKLVPRLNLRGKVGTKTLQVESDSPRVEPISNVITSGVPAKLLRVPRTAGPDVRTRVAPLANPSRAKLVPATPPLTKIIEMIELYLSLLPDPVIKDDKNAERAIAKALKLRFTGAEGLIRKAVKKSPTLGAVPQGDSIHTQIMLSQFPPSDKIKRLIKRYPAIADGRTWPPQPNIHQGLL